MINVSNAKVSISKDGKDWEGSENYGGVRMFSKEPEKKFDFSMSWNYTLPNPPLSIVSVKCK